MTVTERLKTMILRARRHPELAWGLSAALVTLTLGLFAVSDIEPGEVALRINNVTGSQTAITQAGWVLRIPGVHSVYLLSAAPQSFNMQGDKDQGQLDVRELQVRASDGSNFHFKDTTIIFQLLGDQVASTVRDSGTGSGYLDWMRPYARAILRDEFGRESTIKVSDPSTYGEAAARAKRRLNELLGKHGLVVTQLVTPRPQFNDAYEHAIEERNALGNALQVIQSNLERASTDRERTLAEVDQEKNAVVQEKRASLEAELARAVADQAKVKREADTFRIEKIAEGQAELSASRRRASELEGELTARYQSRQAEITAFQTQPVERVMEKLGARLKGVTIDIQPYADDATPSRVRYEQVKP